MFGQYAAFIIPSYVVSAIVIVVMAAAIMVQYRKRLGELAKLEESGLVRRSSSQKKTDE